MSDSYSRNAYYSNTNNYHIAAFEFENYSVVWIIINE